MNKFEPVVVLMPETPDQPFEVAVAQGHLSVALGGLSLEQNTGDGYWFACEDWPVHLEGFIRRVPEGDWVLTAPFDPEHPPKTWDEWFDALRLGGAKAPGQLLPYVLPVVLGSMAGAPEGDVLVASRGCVLEPRGEHPVVRLYETLRRLKNVLVGKLSDDMTLPFAVAEEPVSWVRLALLSYGARYDTESEQWMAKTEKDAVLGTMVSYDNTKSWPIFVLDRHPKNDSLLQISLVFFHLHGGLGPVRGEENAADFTLRFTKADAWDVQRGGFCADKVREKAQAALRGYDNAEVRFLVTPLCDDLEPIDDAAKETLSIITKTPDLLLGAEIHWIAVATGAENQAVGGEGDEDAVPEGVEGNSLAKVDPSDVPAEQQAKDMAEDDEDSSADIPPENDSNEDIGDSVLTKPMAGANLHNVEEDEEWRGSNWDAHLRNVEQALATTTVSAEEKRDRILASLTEWIGDDEYPVAGYDRIREIMDVCGLDVREVRNGILVLHAARVGDVDDFVLGDDDLNNPVGGQLYHAAAYVNRCRRREPVDVSEALISELIEVQLHSGMRTAAKYRASLWGAFKAHEEEIIGKGGDPWGHTWRDLLVRRHILEHRLDMKAAEDRGLGKWKPRIENVYQALLDADFDPLPDITDADARRLQAEDDYRKLLSQVGKKSGSNAGGAT